MAIDEAILWAHSQGIVPPTLRFYGWKPAAVSLGYFQDAGDVRLDECAKLGYDVVRRPTGGRAILHDEEITYSVVIREEFLSGDRSVMGSYQWISGGLVEGLRLMGIEASLENQRSDSTRPRVREHVGKAACFAKAARCDIVYQGRKIIGSAQVRKHDCILQHGSIPLSLRRQTLQQIFENSGDLSAAVALSEIDATRNITFDEGVRLFVVGFSEVLGIGLEVGELTPMEQDRSIELLETKHQKRDWVFDRRARRVLME